MKITINDLNEMPHEWITKICDSENRELIIEDGVIKKIVVKEN